MEKNRNYGIDLLRIVSMYMVIILHILKHGGILGNLPVLSIRYEVAWFLEIACYGAVNCYALISGYVGLNAQHKYTAIVKLWLQVFFYTILLTLGIWILRPELVGKEQIKQALLPVVGNNYWYFTAYFPLFFVMPMLNHIVHTMSQKQVKTVLIQVLILFSILPTVFRKDIFVMNRGYCFLWLAYLYVLGAYIKKYALLEKFSKRMLLGCYLGMILLTWVTKYLIEYFQISQSAEVVDGNWFVEYTSPTIIIGSVALLLLFAKLKMNRGVGLIRFFSPLSFGVYLIHVHPLVWRHVMKLRFVSYTEFGTVKMVFCIVFTAVALYIVCSLADWCRYFLFKLGGKQ